ncbi:hypothetical protein JTB14_008149 [Gonioctena quinquepunctata]|nr:hypothetical protein JTB14_008149 [Gonioctena quinquepunctata]
MDGKGENTVRKPRRAAAGVNKGLPDDFTWPRGFGVGGNGNTEKDRQELERMKEDLEKKQKEKEIENRMKILQLEHELKEAELAAAADEENDDTNRSVSSKKNCVIRNSMLSFSAVKTHGNFGIT